MPAAINAITEPPEQYCVRVDGVKRWGSIRVPDYQTSYGPVTIGNNITYCVNMFANCYNFNQPVTISENAVNCYDMFTGCRSFNQPVTIPSKVAFIDRYAFQNCASLETVYFNAKNCECDDLDTASITLFYGCTNLQTMTFGEGVEIIPYSIGSQLASLTTVNIPSTVKYIRIRAFYNCTGLQTINFAPNCVCEYFATQSFKNTAITSIHIPENLKAIYHNSFEDCKYLSSITIPASVESINSNAFLGCVALNSIVVDEGNTVYDSRDDCNAIIESRSNKLIVGCISTIIPNDVVEIGAYAFYGKGITNINIPSNVKNICEQAFYGCALLQTLTFDEGVETIGYYTFAHCTSLTSVTFANSLKEIGDSAFYSCENLATVKMSSGLERIKTSAFAGCTKLATVYITNDAIYNVATNVWDPGQLLYYAQSVYVLDSVYENSENTNDYLTDASIFNQPTNTTTIDGQDYYLFTKMQQ